MNSSEPEVINPGLATLIRPIEGLHEDPKNVRLHGKDSLAGIRKSLEQFGQQEPIIALKSGRVIHGNGRLTVAKEMGWTKMAVLTFADEKKATAFAISMNRTAELSTWDDKLLAKVLKDLQHEGTQASDLAFSDKDISSLLLSIEQRDTTQPVESVPPPVPKNPITKPGDLWILGEHRLLCGSSTDPAALRKLFDIIPGHQSLRFDACITSPPYSDQRTYSQEKFVWLDLMNEAWDALIQHAQPDCHILVNLGMSYKDRQLEPYWDPWLAHCKESGWPLFGWYVWDKLAARPGDFQGRLATCHEFVFHFNLKLKQARKIIKTKNEGVIFHGTKRVKDGSLIPRDQTSKRFRQKDGSLKQATSPDKVGQPYKVPDSVIRVLRETNNQTDHPAVFSVAFAAFLMQAFSSPEDVIYEPFSGSGTTMIAAEQLGRRCFGVDISPGYCDVAVQRWEQLTGQKATKGWTAS